MLSPNPEAMMFNRRIPVSLALLLLFGSGAIPSHEAEPPRAPAAPKLVVVIVVDQMRTDYLERYGATFTGGLRRLVREGAWFKRGAYPYLNTITCAGHSTIATGSFPYRHGMILNAWYDRETGEAVPCTEDGSVREITYKPLTPSSPSDSGRAILLPTLADRIRERAHGRVATFSLKARAAISLAGHKGDPVIWFDERGGWATSSAFAPGPTPFVQQFIDSHPITADYGRKWERLLDPEAYQNADDAEGELPDPKVTGWTRTFPHAIGDPGGKPDKRFYTQWMRSPLSDDYLGRMACAAIDAMHLGKGEGTDFLGVSFSALDLVGHAFGPNSHEVQDILARVDVTIGRLLDHLDATVGAGNYAVGFSSDHGVGEIPEQVTGGGRQTNATVRAALDAALAPFFGPGHYVAKSEYTDIYLAKGVWKRLERNPAATAAALEALRGVPGIAYAFTGSEIAEPRMRTSADPTKRAAALNYYPGRSGDFIIVPRDNWMFTTSATSHGTLYPHDQRVPMILLGPGINKGTYDNDATPADLAPTLAALARVAFEQADGRVLTEAMAPPATGR
jgi:predicted AlkP superfamily pyrophosphatase or phosphodiesterase